jgi:hypothetical protein
MNLYRSGSISILESDHPNHCILLSRWRERVRVRVDSRYILLTFVLCPWGEEIRTCALLKLKVCTFKF